jgi:hypothetical protein
VDLMESPEAVKAREQSEAAADPLGLAAPKKTA